MSVSLEKLSTICALSNKAPSGVALAFGACQKSHVLSFQPASNTEQMVAKIGPAAWFQREGSFAKMGALFLRTFRILRLVSTLKILHIVIHSLTYSTLAAVCGTRFSPKNHETLEMAHCVDLCGGRCLCCVSIDLNRVDAVIVSFCASEFPLHRLLTLLALRLPFQMRFHWFAAHLLFIAAVSIPRSLPAAPKQMGTLSAPNWATISFPKDLSFASRVGQG